MDDLERAFGQVYPLWHGPEGQRNRRKAVAALRPLAEAAFLPAVFALAMSYFDGQGVRKDLNQAIRLFRIGAETGHAAAQNMLGAVYASASPTYPCGRDDAEATRWFRQAALGGDAGGQYNLAVRYAQGSGGVEADPAQAWAWASLAARRSPIAFSAAEGLRRQLEGTLDAAALGRAAALLGVLENEVPVFEEPLFYWRRCAAAAGCVS